MADKIIELSHHRAPVCYTVHFIEYWDGRLEIKVEDIADDERSRGALASTLLRAAEHFSSAEVIARYR